MDIINSKGINAMSLMKTGKKRSLITIWSVLGLMMIRTAQGEPCTPNWSKGFERQGMNGIVQTMIVFDDGHGPAVYAGGEFTEAGGVAANRIAKWDGEHWSPLSTGMDNTIWALAVFNDGTGPALYAGGYFHNAGGVTTNHIAKWNPGPPGSWSPVGGGTDNDIGALAVYNDGLGVKLYAGGAFLHAGTTAVNRIARWDGTNWSDPGGGVQGTPVAVVRALSVFNDGTGEALYVGGLFTSPGKNIAKYKGSTWFALGSGASNMVNTLTVFDDGLGEALYVGGDFTSAGGVVNARRIARWSGSAWSALGTGFADRRVNALTVFDDGNGAALYAGGEFTATGAIQTRRIAKWDGAQWSTLGQGILDDESDPDWCGLPPPECGPRPTMVRALLAFDQMLFVGGDIVSAGGVPAKNLARWMCPIRPDFDGDGDIDTDDFNIFEDCSTAPGIAPTVSCQKADLDTDNDVDQDDFAPLQRCHTGADLPSDPACLR